MKHVYHPKGHVINDDGLGYQTSAFEFYIVLMGTVAVYINDPSQQQFLAGGLKKMKKMKGKCFERANEILADKYEFMKMKAGEAFGETSLINGKPPEESYLCTTECHFAVLSKKKFDETLLRIELKTKKGWKNFFKSHPIFEKLTLVSLEKLFYLIELKIFSRNQTIFREGEEVNGFYLIYQGDVSLTKKVEGKYKNDFDINKFINRTKQEEGNPLSSNQRIILPNASLSYRLTAI